MTHTTYSVILKTCVVCIETFSYEEEFEALFRDCIHSIRVDDEEIPELMKITETSALRESGLTENAWEVNELYVNVPENYTCKLRMTGGMYGGRRMEARFSMFGTRIHPKSR